MGRGSAGRAVRVSLESTVAALAARSLRQSFNVIARAGRRTSCAPHLGGRTLPPTAAEDLLEIFTRRYEMGATILSSNRPIEDFGAVLGDNVAAGVLLDRFLHHAEIVQLTGRSYRIHDRQQRRAAGTDFANIPPAKVPQASRS